MPSSWQPGGPWARQSRPIGEPSTGASTLVAVLRLGGAARPLTAADLPALRPLLDRDPIANCFVASRVEAAGLDPWRLGAELWGYGTGRLDAACFAGANLVPVGDAPAALAAFADRARRQGRRCSSIVGPAHAVAALWERLEPHWGPAREVRARQPLLATRTPAGIAGDPKVRRVSMAELDLLMPACVAMFTEEVGTSPLGNDNGAAYRARVRDLVLAGRAFARIEGGQVLFKAELGAVSVRACQVQGVWVHPEHRGRGLGTLGTAAVVDEALRSVAPVVSLYVNDYNLPARRAYQRVGFENVGTFSSVLF
jgi:predicted GNAT family acetyltransferase